nr:histidine kinase [uncultured Flavobacterium sp.]
MVNLLFAQDPITIKLAEKDGLPDVEFYDIIEDSKGFVWLAADKGLYRFDGKDYQSYTNVNKRGLSVFGLKFDNQNQLWCNNISGQFFNLKNDKLELFLDLKNELKGELAEFVFLKDKLLVFSTGLILAVDLKTKKRTNLLKQSGKESHIVRAPFKFRDKIYFTIDDEIFSLAGSKIQLAVNDKIEDFGSATFPKFFEYGQNLFLITYDNLLNQNRFFKISNKRLIEVLLPNKIKNQRIIAVSELDNFLWFCTSAGIIKIEEKNNRFLEEAVFLKDDFITRIISDRNETVWVSTLNNGVFIIPELQVKNYRNIVDNDNISVVEKIDDTKIAVGTTKGNLYITDLRNNEKQEIKLNNKRKISELLYLKEQNVLLISTENSSYTYNVGTRKIKESNSFFNAKDLHRIDNSNQIIYCGFDKAAILKYEHDAVVFSKKLNASRAYRAFYDKKFKRIYVSYVDDLVVYEQDYSFKSLQYKSKNVIAKDICQTDNGIIWIATFSNGILGYKNNQFVQNFDAGSGLKSNVIQEIKSDGDDLWIVTDKGIQVLDANTNEFRSSVINNGNSVGNSKGIIVNDKTILLATQEHFFEIDKTVRPKRYHLKEIYIKSIAINEKDTIVQEKYSLPYYKNRIKFTFHSNGFYPNDELLFEYRLQGLNDNWIPLDKNVNFVNFNSLPSRDYSFEIRAKSSSENEYVSTKVDFQINQPYWKKWWFISGLLLISFGLLILFYRNKLAVKEKEKELALKKAKFENELAILKLENLKSQMNPHFIFNALNSIQEYIVLNEKNLAGSYLAKFADLIRAYLEHSSKGYISLREEIECLDTYLQLEKLRFEDKFSYTITSSISNEEIKIPTMLIQPYVENAIKHGLLHKKDNRNLSINFELLKEEKMLRCIILDNGIGREKAAQLRNVNHRSFATEATQHRLDLLNFGRERKIGVTIDDLVNDDKNAIGTKVTLLIPILN